MLKIEFPAENKPLAAAIGRALLDYAGAERTTGLSPTHAAPYIGGVVEAEAPGCGVELDPKGQVVAHHLPDANHTSTDDEPANDAPADGRKDQKGVVFNPTFCANAKEPFYTSGAVLGQWKKARGCDQAAYDAWYANEHAKAQAAWHEKADSLGIQTGAAAAAFSAQATDTAAAKPAAPTNGGELMKWVSERQVANTLTQADIDAAWAATGFAVADLFGANAAAAVASVYGILSAKAGA